MTEAEPPPNKPDAVTLWNTIGKIATAVTTIGLLIRAWMHL